MWPSDVARYAPDATPEGLLDASFRFLLEREPKEAILAASSCRSSNGTFQTIPRGLPE